MAQDQDPFDAAKWAALDSQGGGAAQASPIAPEIEYRASEPAAVQYASDPDFYAKARNIKQFGGGVFDWASDAYGAAANQFSGSGGSPGYRLPYDMEMPSQGAGIPDLLGLTQPAPERPIVFRQPQKQYSGGVH